MGKVDLTKQRFAFIDDEETIHEVAISSGDQLRANRYELANRPKVPGALKDWGLIHVYAQFCAAKRDSSIPHGDLDFEDWADLHVMQESDEEDPVITREHFELLRTAGRIQTDEDFDDLMVVEEAGEAQAATTQSSSPA